MEMWVNGNVDDEKRLDNWKGRPFSATVVLAFVKRLFSHQSSVQGPLLEVVL